MFFVGVYAAVLSSKRQTPNNPEFTPRTSDKLARPCSLYQSLHYFFKNLFSSFFFCFLTLLGFFLSLSLRCKRHWGCGAARPGHSWGSDCRLDCRKHLLDRQQFGPNWGSKTWWHFEDNVNSWSYGASEGYRFGSQIWVIINFANIAFYCCKVF